MPAYNIKAPDGKTYRVEGPDQQGALMALRKALGSGQGPASNPPPMTGMQQAGDVLSSFGSGLVRGVGDVAGMPGDLFAGVNQALDTGYNYLTGEDYHTPMPKYLPTSQAAKDLASQVTGMLAHWEQALTAIGFLDPQAPRKLMPRLNQLFNRAALTQEEIHILRGIAKLMAKTAGPADG